MFSPLQLVHLELACCRLMLSPPVLPPTTAGLPPPEPWGTRKIPRTITYQRKRANRRILNEDEFVSMLHEFGDVKVEG